MIANTAIVFDNVTFGQRVIVEDYCLIGIVGAAAPEYGTEIGDDAVLRAHTIIYAGNRIGQGLSTGNKANIRENNTIGDNVSIGTLAVIEHSSEIGDGVRIHSQAFVSEYSKLEAGCWIGPNVVLTNAKYPNTHSAKQNLQGPTICAGARLGANSTVLPGIVVGEYSIVGAGSVVTKDVPAGVIVAGNPAVFIRELNSERS